MSSAAHQPGEHVKKVTLIHAGEDTDSVVIPIATEVESYCKLPGQAAYTRSYDDNTDIGKAIVEQMKEVDASKGLYGLILVSKKFLAKISDVKTAIEELLRQDNKLQTKLYALVLMDVDEQLLNQSFPSLTIRGIHAVNYRSYQTEIRALAEGVYKIWLGCNVYIDRLNNCSTSNEASLTVSNDPVENDETSINDGGVNVPSESIDDSIIDRLNEELEHSSLSTQSNGCQYVQTAQVPATPEAATPDTANSNDTSEDDAAGLPIGTVPVLKEADIKKSVEEASLGEKLKENHSCNQHDCHSKERILPENEFFDSSSLVKDFGANVREELMYILDPPKACVKDWKHLASFKKVPYKKITYWETQKSGTLAYLDYLGTKFPCYTVAEFKKDLRGIQRMDVLDSLKDFGF